MADTSVKEVDLNPIAVLPSTLLRGGVLGLIITIFAYLHLIVYWEWASRLFAPLEPIRSVVVGLTLPTSVAAIAALAVGGYRRRQYNITGEGVIKRGGFVRSHECKVSYDMITDVTLTRSKIQRVFNVGTICLTYEDGGNEQRLWLSYVRDPKEIYERLQSECGGTTRSPEITIEPNPLSAARQGAMKGIFLTPVFGAIPAVVLVVIALLASVPLAIIGLSVAGIVTVLVFLFAIRSYLQYDGRSYEIHRTHVESVMGANRSSVSFSDVVSVSASGDETGTVKLLGNDEETLMALRHIPAPEETRSRIERLVET